VRTRTSEEVKKTDGQYVTSDFKARRVGARGGPASTGRTEPVTNYREKRMLLDRTYPRLVRSPIVAKVKQRRFQRGTRGLGRQGTIAREETRGVEQKKSPKTRDL